MIDPTLPQLLLIRVTILFFQAIPLLSALHTFHSILALLLSNPLLLPRGPLLLNLYTGLETLHLLYLHLHHLPRLQAPAVHPPLRSRAERQALFQKVLTEIPDPEAYVRGWFRWPEKLDCIGREDLGEFIGWAVFEGRVPEGAEGREEVEGYVRAVERLLAGRGGKGKGFAFREGRGRSAGLRLTLERVGFGGWVGGGRSLLWSGIVGLVDAVTAARMRMMGYGFWRRSVRAGWWGWVPRVWPLRAWVLLPEWVRGGGMSRAEGLGYWYRRHTSKRRLPVVFIHGIGVGLHPHVEFLRELDERLNGRSKKSGIDHGYNDRDDGDDGEVGILALEVLPISSRLTAPILRREDFLHQITQVLDSHAPHFSRFVLASHSYGSVLSTHIFSHPPLAERLSALLFIDPVSILLHLPDVAYNFTARPPQTANEWQLWFFASKDPGVAWTLGRHFFWSENVLWREDLEKFVTERKGRCTVALASRDLIVDTETVGRYLIGGNHGGLGHVTRRLQEGGREEKSKPNGIRQRHTRNEQSEIVAVGDEWKKKEWKGRGIEVMWFEDIDHAQVFDTLQTREELINVLDEYSRGE